MSREEFEEFRRATLKKAYKKIEEARITICNGDHTFTPRDDGVFLCEHCGECTHGHTDPNSYLANIGEIYEGN